jgi:hypothetical protein
LRGDEALDLRRRLRRAQIGSEHVGAHPVRRSQLLRQLLQLLLAVCHQHQIPAAAS